MTNEHEQLKRRIQLLEDEVGRLSGELADVQSKLKKADDAAWFKRALSGGGNAG